MKYLKYCKKVELDEKWVKRLAMLSLKLYGLELETYSLYTFSTTSKINMLDLKTAMQKLLARTYDTQLKCSRVFMITLLNYITEHIFSCLGASDTNVVEQYLVNLISMYKHRYVYEYNMIVFMYKPEL